MRLPTVTKKTTANTCTEKSSQPIRRKFHDINDDDCVVVVSLSFTALIDYIPRLQMMYLAGESNAFCFFVRNRQYSVHYSTHLKIDYKRHVIHLTWNAINRFLIKLMLVINYSFDIYNEIAFIFYSLSSVKRACLNTWNFHIASPEIDTKLLTVWHFWFMAFEIFHLFLAVSFCDISFFFSFGLFYCLQSAECWCDRPYDILLMCCFD